MQHASPPSSDHIEFPAVCPRCLNHTGTVRRVSTVPNQPLLVRLHVCCQTCDHEWEIDKGQEWEAKNVPMQHGLPEEPYT